jgi:hypothetical protein
LAAARREEWIERLALDGLGHTFPVIAEVYFQLFAGYVGLGMLDATCPGQVFTSPTPDQMIKAAEAVDTGAGVLFIVKSYEGDRMNFTMLPRWPGERLQLS